MLSLARLGALLSPFLLLLAAVGIAGDVPALLSHQGRLLDAADQPLTGTYTITYSIFDSPSGGVVLWTETQSNVQVTDGLFASDLGSVNPISADVLSSGSGGGGGGSVGRYLEIQVGGVVLSPRMRLAASPYAMASSRVSGDIQTSPNQVRIGGMSGSTTGTIRMAATPDSATVYLDVDSDDDGIPESSERRTVSANDFHHNVVSRGGSTTGTIRMAANPDGATSEVGWDGDNDDVLDNSCASTISPTKSQLAIKTKGTSAQRQSATVSTEAAGAATFQCAIDDDADGVAENFVESSSTPEGSSVRVVSLNGLPPGEPVLDNIALSATGTSSTVSLAKGVAKVGLGVASAVGVPGASVLSSRYLTNNGLDSTAAVQSSNGTAAAFKAINTKGTGATVRAAMGSTDTASTSQLEADLDGDGTMENAVKSTAAGAVAGIVVSSRFGSGPRQTTSMDGSFSHATMRCTADNDDDGAPENFVESDASGSGSSLRVISLNGLPPGVPYEDNIRLSADGTASSITIDEPGTGHSIQFEVDATGPSIRVIDGGTIKSEIAGSGDAYFSSSLGVGVPAPTHHIDVAGGAYCDGSNWVNASDKNAKENFEDVNGLELLNKISELEISQWNYKGKESDKHIGPTAQDFQKTFGVGSDGKSISTIDPSGIALAAIQELYKQLKQKDAEMDQLKAELKKLREEVKRK